MLGAGADRGLTMIQSPRLSTVGVRHLHGCLFRAGRPLDGAPSGVQLLIPETGKPGSEWIADVDAASGLFFTGACSPGHGSSSSWVSSASWHWSGSTTYCATPVRSWRFAPILGTVGLTLVTVASCAHRGGVRAGAGLLRGRPCRTGHSGSHFDTFAATALVTNRAGNFLGWGVAVPMFAVAIIRTRALPRWNGWLGSLVGVLAGWLGLLSPASDVIEGISSIGVIGFFVFMLSMGVAILRRHEARQSGDIQ